MKVFKEFIQDTNLTTKCSLYSMPFDGIGE